MTLRLGIGAALLEEKYRKQIAAFFFSALDNNNGGFKGRRGVGELYYTGFAVRTLALLGELNATSPVADFLKSSIRDGLEGAELTSLLMSSLIFEMATGRDLFAESCVDRSAWSQEQFALLRCADGGFASAQKMTHSSTYHTFLMTATMQSFGIPLQEPEKIVNLILKRQREDGGFVELAPLRQSGTNPTAAAVCLLKIFGVEDYQREKTREFFFRMLAKEGGFCASPRVPVPDLLSTFTALVALHAIAPDVPLNHSAMVSFVDSLQMENGGYCGGIWDSVPDVEYTFYGFATRSFLSSFV